MVYKMLISALISNVVILQLVKREHRCKLYDVCCVVAQLMKAGSRRVSSLSPASKHSAVCIQRCQIMLVKWFRDVPGWTFRGFYWILDYRISVPCETVYIAQIPLKQVLLYQYFIVTLLWQYTISTYFLYTAELEHRCILHL